MPSNAVVNGNASDQPPSANVVSEGDTVVVSYVGTFTDGEEFDKGNLTVRVGSGQVIKGFDEALVGMAKGASKKVTIPPEKAYGESDPKKIIPIPLSQEFDKIVNITTEEFNTTFGSDPEIGKEYKLPDMKWSVKVARIENKTVYIEQIVVSGTELEYPYGKGIATVEGDKIKVTLTPDIGAKVQTLFGTATITKANETHMWLDFNHPLAGKTLIFDLTVLNVTKSTVDENAKNDSNEGKDICSGITKSEKPEMDVFVMSYCPFGLQMEKGVIPVKELFGDNADIRIRFVNYAMHGKKEVDENTYQYCIQKEQPDKFWQYLRCFVGNTDHEACMDEAGIDSDALDACVANANEEFEITKYYEDKSTWASGRFPLYKVDDADNAKYGIRGSPTVVINGKIAQVYPRDPETVKEYLCCAFENPPDECSETLSKDNPSSGPGWSTASSGGSGAGCGT
ncbi:MAG: hypothetical protein GXO64_03125 [Candidatus Micrarchaeota archaeon]|nr:hypothetical protein [Candidatus Micrarchaeota archaeon]